MVDKFIPREFYVSLSDNKGERYKGEIFLNFSDDPDKIKYICKGSGYYQERLSVSGHEKTSITSSRKDKWRKLGRGEIVKARIIVDKSSNFIDGNLCSVERTTGGTTYLDIKWLKNQIGKHGTSLEQSDGGYYYCDFVIASEEEINKYYEHVKMYGSYDPLGRYDFSKNSIKYESAIAENKDYVISPYNNKKYYDNKENVIQFAKDHTGLYIEYGGVKGYICGYYNEIDSERLIKPFILINLTNPYSGGHSGHSKIFTMQLNIGDPQKSYYYVSVKNICKYIEQYGSRHYDPKALYEFYDNLKSENVLQEKKDKVTKTGKKIYDSGKIIKRKGIKNENIKKRKIYKEVIVEKERGKRDVFTPF